MPTREANFDGLIGPSHNYAGLSPGNLPSQSNAGAASSPRTAALQSLSKMAAVRDLGLPQFVLPPQPRPALPFLRAVGFAGDDAAVLETAHAADPSLLAAAWSASCMWTANAATVTPSRDASDGRLHLSPANLVGNLHRSLEAQTTHAVLRAIFADPSRFAVHPPLPAQHRFSDEGAANHTRLSRGHDAPGVHFFTFGFDPARPGLHAPAKHPARQSRAASRAIARRHALAPAQTVEAQQHPDAVDAGVFHNDVISTGNETVLLHHARSFVDTGATLDSLDRALRALDPAASLTAVAATDEDFSLEDAVSSYVFNSQLLTLDTPPGEPARAMALVAPFETRENPRVSAWVDRVVGDPSNPIARVVYLDVRESMRNGGGPACLRLRVPLTSDQVDALHPGVALTDDRLAEFRRVVERTYPESIAPDQLRDHRLARACLDATDAVLGVLGLRHAVTL